MYGIKVKVSWDGAKNLSILGEKLGESSKKEADEISKWKVILCALHVSRTQKTEELPAGNYNLEQEQGRVAGAGASVRSKCPGLGPPISMRHLTDRFPPVLLQLQQV